MAALGFGPDPVEQVPLERVSEEGPALGGAGLDEG